MTSVVVKLPVGTREVEGHRIRGFWKVMQTSGSSGYVRVFSIKFARVRLRIVGGMTRFWS